jgi:hypothetical protein
MPKVHRPESGRQEFLAAFADQQHNGHDRVAVDAREPFDGSDAATFQQHPQHHHGLGWLNPQVSQWAVAAVDPTLATSNAADAGIAQMVFAVLSGLEMVASYTDRSRLFLRLSLECTCHSGIWRKPGVVDPRCGLPAASGFFVGFIAPNCDYFTGK